MTEFQRAVIKTVCIIPAGRVASYGQIAAYLGMPRAARQVGWALSSLDGIDNLPWWRIVNNAGRLTIRGNHFSNAELQRQLLIDEGVVVKSDYSLNIAKYRYRAQAPDLSDLGLDPQYINSLLDIDTI